MKNKKLTQGQKQKIIIAITEFIQKRDKALDKFKKTVKNIHTQAMNDAQLYFKKADESELAKIERLSRILCLKEI